MDVTKTTFFNKAPVPPPIAAEPEITGPLTLRPSDITDLSRLLGRNIKDADDLLLAARNVTTVNVQGAEITLEPYLLDRLRSRCHPTEDFNAFLKARIVELLHGFVGA